MDYENQATMLGSYAQKQAQAAVYAQLGDQPEQPSLNRILARIERATDSAREIASRLEHHSDVLHGSPPKADSAGQIKPVRSGLVGSIEAALDCLESALGTADNEARRACTLA